MSVNRYEGMEWNGKRWCAVDEDSGELVPQQLTIWQKSRPWEKVFMVSVAVGVVLLLAWLLPTGIL